MFLRQILSFKYLFASFSRFYGIFTLASLLNASLCVGFRGLRVLVIVPPFVIRSIRSIVFFFIFTVRVFRLITLSFLSVVRFLSIVLPFGFLAFFLFLGLLLMVLAMSRSMRVSMIIMAMGCVGAVRKKVPTRRDGYSDSSGGPE